MPSYKATIVGEWSCTNTIDAEDLQEAIRELEGEDGQGPDGGIDGGSWSLESGELENVRVVKIEELPPRVQAKPPTMYTAGSKGRPVVQWCDFLWGAVKCGKPAEFGTRCGRHVGETV